MKERQYSKIPDFWSNNNVVIEEMVCENCSVNCEGKGLGLIKRFWGGMGDSSEGCSVPPRDNVGVNHGKNFGRVERKVKAYSDDTLSLPFEYKYPLPLLVG